MTMIDLDRYNGLWLFGEDNTSIEERWNDVMNKDVDSGFTLIIKVIIIVEALNSTTPHHSVHLPHFIVLRNQHGHNTDPHIKMKVEDT